VGFEPAARYTKAEVALAVVAGDPVPVGVDEQHQAPGFPLSAVHMTGWTAQILIDYTIPVSIKLGDDDVLTGRHIDRGHTFLIGHGCVDRLAHGHNIFERMMRDAAPMSSFLPHATSAAAVIGFDGNADERLGVGALTTFTPKRALGHMHLDTRTI